MIRAAALALLLAGCVAAEAPVRESAAVGMTADGRGLQPNGTPLRIDFGRDEPGAVRAAAKLIGANPTERVVLEECGAGPMVSVRWANGFAMNFQYADFVGWSSEKKAGTPVAGTSGLQPGTPREALVGATFRQTTLGEEFTSGEVSGLVEGGEVRMIWAGTTCFFR